MTAELSQLWHTFADHSLGAYAPTYDTITRAMADDPDIMALVAEAADDAKMPNNLLAAGHYLVLGEPDSELAAIYAGTSNADPARPFRELILAHRDQVLELMATRKVQTNEVLRCAAIAPVLAFLAKRHGTDLALIDAGTSAGLNLLVDQYRVDLGSVAIGPADSPLHLRPELLDQTPSATDFSIGWRQGFDRSPIDASDPDQARWLRALVWPDQPQRQARLSAAISVFEQHRPPVVQAEAVAGLQAAIAASPASLTPVVLTTWVYFYFPEDVRAAFDQAIVDADREVAWVSMEMPGIVQGIADDSPPAGIETEANLLGLVTTVPGSDARREVLGWTHGHGTWLDWRVC